MWYRREELQRRQGRRQDRSVREGRSGAFAVSKRQSESWKQGVGGRLNAVTASSFLNPDGISDGEGKGGDENENEENGVGEKGGGDEGEEDEFV